MEKKFYPDSFEQLLKESTDNFRMYPSKRVWYSIYNDLHPSRKWPSLAIWLLLITSVVFIGLSNRNQVMAPNDNSQMIASTPATKAPNTIFDLQNSNTTGKVTTAPQNVSNSGSNTTIRIKTKTPASQNENDQQFALITVPDQKTEDLTTDVLVNVADANDKDLSKSFVTSELPVELQKQVVSPAVVNNFGDKEKETTDINLISKKSAEIEKKLSKDNKITQVSDKVWIEDYAFHNKPLISKWKAKVKYQLYFTPSVGYRTLVKTTDYIPASASLVAPGANVEDYKEALKHAAAINMEIGGNILYNVSKNWNLKVGIQLNYTSYGINAYELKHPTTTTLLLNDLDSGFPILEPRSTSLVNTAGVSPKRLNNNTYQVSIPLGADLKLAGRNNLKWYAGATIQPTYMIGGNAYLISSDLKNYVADRSMLSKWNLNAGVETFISYQTKGGIIINAGPQFRYQILSTYGKQYTYDEKLYNVGLKLGITTRF